jgi:hypothetical protein
MTHTVEFDAAGVLRLCEEDHELGFALLYRFTEVVVDRLQAAWVRLLDRTGTRHDPGALPRRRPE